MAARTSWRARPSAKGGQKAASHPAEGLPPVMLQNLPGASALLIKPETVTSGKEGEPDDIVSPRWQVVASAHVMLAQAGR